MAEYTSGTIIENPAGQRTNPKIIADWNNKRKNSSKNISAMVPFVDIIMMLIMTK